MDIIRPFEVVLDNDSEQFVRADSFDLVSVDCEAFIDSNALRPLEIDGNR